MDVSENKSKFCTNVILLVSLVICKTSDIGKGISQYCHITDLADKPKVILPVLSFNVINRGSHAGNKLAIQEVMIFLVDASSIWVVMNIRIKVYHNLKKVIKEKYRKDATKVGDEGRFVPSVPENKEFLSC
ncbi:Eno1 [Lemmus lemmus]